MMVEFTYKGPAKLGLLFNKRGAMFGLDARIALAIFAGLGIIMGATLYYAIKQTKANTMIGDFEGLAQAYTAMVVDIKRDAWINQLTANPGWPGWNGPYTPLENAVINPRYPLGVMSIDRYSDAEWTNGSGVAASTSNCWNWARLGGVYVLSVMDADIIVDGAVNGDRGKLRYNDAHVAYGSPIAAWYKISPCLNGPI